jgi:hypothetical protein
MTITMTMMIINKNNPIKNEQIIQIDISPKRREMTDIHIKRCLT